LFGKGFTEKDEEHLMEILEFLERPWILIIGVNLHIIKKLMAYFRKTVKFKSMEKI
jgi:hypothetical protein